MAAVDFEEGPEDYTGRRRAPEPVPSPAADHLTLAHLAALIGEDDAFAVQRQQALIALGAIQTPIAAEMELAAMRRRAMRDAHTLRDNLAAWMDLLGEAVEPPMPNAVCPDPISHSAQPVRGEDGRPPLVQDRRRCPYCAGWINPGDLNANGGL